ncbi:hypothetical protein B0H34DRAFT_107437 [Crassisporium funariophilum]|nr:hypothetical protein B0H34DRAFT_107437 [Crassisporium funariophilum]
MTLRLLPPSSRFNRDSVVSSSGSSILSFDPDSKYPSGFATPNGLIVPSHAQGTMRGLLPYPYDPTFDDSEPMDDEDRLHDPLGKGGFRGERSSFPWRGVLNVGVLVGLILALLCLFVFYPVLSFYRDLKRNELIDANIRINGTGQAPVL